MKWNSYIHLFKSFIQKHHWPSFQLWVFLSVLLLWSGFPFTTLHSRPDWWEGFSFFHLNRATLKLCQRVHWLSLFTLLSETFHFPAKAMHRASRSQSLWGFRLAPFSKIEVTGRSVTFAAQNYSFHALQACRNLTHLQSLPGVHDLVGLSVSVNSRISICIMSTELNLLQVDSSIRKADHRKQDTWNVAAFKISHISKTCLVVVLSK